MKCPIRYIHKEELPAKRERVKEKRMGVVGLRVRLTQQQLKDPLPPLSDLGPLPGCLHELDTNIQRHANTNTNILRTRSKTQMQVNQ